MAGGQDSKKAAAAEGSKGAGQERKLTLMDALQVVDAFTGSKANATVSKGLAAARSNWRIDTTKRSEEIGIQKMNVRNAAAQVLQDLLSLRLARVSCLLGWRRMNKSPLHWGATSAVQSRTS